MTAHQLRHTAASLMIASGAHVKTVQRQLGHKTATMTLDSTGTCSRTISTTWPIG
ncbi:tyrosine-type recombinase/integrase [Nocardia sp. NPDC059691]|uniref:tyrosine-type recombinase/integrase n=1 Tax=unclassified Nocardia TaxID=2637762 RepID=UPI003682AEA9